MRRQRGQTKTEEIQGVILAWREAHGWPQTWDMEKCIEWGIAEGIYELPEIDPMKVARREFSKAAAKSKHEDPQGRTVRDLHTYYIIDEEGQRRWLWADGLRADPDVMRNCFQCQRNGIKQDVIKLHTTVQSYNDNNTHGAYLEFDWDFNPDVEEASESDEYPDAPPVDDE